MFKPLTLPEQEYIFEHYNVDLYKSICSPLRLENRPSFITKIKNDKVRWDDYGTGEYGDVYNFIMCMYGCDFKTAANKIKDILSGVDVEAVIRDWETKTPKEKDKLEVITYKSFRPFEIKYWLSRGITEDILITDNVFPLKMYKRNGVFKFTSTVDNPKFVYYLNEDRTSWKIYSPLAEPEFKWISQGLNLVPYESKPEGLHQDLILFSSKKDRLVFKSLGLPFDTTSLLAEGNYAAILNLLETEFSGYRYIYSLLDFDNAGETSMINLKEKSNNRIIPIEIPTSYGNYFSTIAVKDLDDVYMKLGKTFFNKFIKDIL